MVSDEFVLSDDVVESFTVEESDVDVHSGVKFSELLSVTVSDTVSTCLTRLHSTVT